MQKTNVNPEVHIELMKSKVTIVCWRFGQDKSEMCIVS